MELFNNKISLFTGQNDDIKILIRGDSLSAGLGVIYMTTALSASRRVMNSKPAQLFAN